MKVTKFKQELDGLSVQDLRKKLDQLRREAFSLRLNATTAHIKDYSEFKKFRKNVARVLTRLQAAAHE